MKKVILLFLLSSAIVADNSYEIYVDSRTDKPDSGDPDLEGVGYGGRAILFEDKLMLDLSKKYSSLYLQNVNVIIIIIIKIINILNL